MLVKLSGAGRQTVEPGGGLTMSIGGVVPLPGVVALVLVVLVVVVVVAAPGGVCAQAGLQPISRPTPATASARSRIRHPPEYSSGRPPSGQPPLSATAFHY
jgi:hypothetical protein